MKKIIVILFFFLVMGITLESEEIPSNCNAKCYWSYDLFDCFVDGIGPQCGDMKNPKPYSTWIPCECCNIITPSTK